MLTRTTLLSLVSILLLLGDARSAPPESPEQWFRDGRTHVETAKKLTPLTKKARNVILFVGDGMGVSTVTAARILEGQLRGESGEENRLFFETFPYLALVKTYGTDIQTSESAGTMTAMVTGVKTRAGFLSVSQLSERGEAAHIDAHKLTTILELAERAGLSTGIVTTTRVTHATPGACYAHATERWWESDARLPQAARDIGILDNARQLLEFGLGDGPEVVLGGGRRNFLPVTSPDPEYPQQTGERTDERDLTAQWLRRPQSAYVWNKKQFDQLDLRDVKRLLGLFEPSHMHYEHDRATRDGAGEPSLADMTEKAIEMLARNRRGFFLMVEGGRIDHAHHETNAYRALTDTIAFARAVRMAREKTSRDDTLIVVTADHSNPMTIAGYSARGHAILGKVNDAGPYASPGAVARDDLGLPFTTLAYVNGPGYAGASNAQPEGPKHRPHPTTGTVPAKSRPDLSAVNTAHPDYLQECTAPLSDCTHAGEDVALYADGPGAQLFRGVIEQNVIFHVMVDAVGLEAAPPKSATTTSDR